MSFPVHRMRRLRKNEQIRRMVRENSLSASNLIYPLFVVHGREVKEEIKYLPGNYYISIDRIKEEVSEIQKLGIAAVLLFGIPQKKNSLATEAYAEDGIVQQAVKEIKSIDPSTVVITDVCLCEYTDHGHCGIMENGYLQNDASLELISKVALSHARAGADMVAPAAMLDGQIRSIRTLLDQFGFVDTAIMAYSAKYASKLYELFFKGTGAVLRYGDKSTHQMDICNSDEAMRELMFDIEEGADIIMVKPALFYLDIVYRAKQEFKMPLAVYNVSGEFAMVKGMSGIGSDEAGLRREIMNSFRRAGADLIITYHAKELAREFLRIQQV
ncbi:MAG TPA: porphobilinogen synthase [Chitinispirillaceae bacterium]|nr:porphobilinogen synthase [Chitinispirillaceae bacterium]